MIRLAFLTFIVGIVSTASVLGQTNCPKLMAAPSGKVTDGKPLGFVAIVTSTSADPMKLTYSWTVSRGKITSGQGTTMIDVDTTGVNDDLTATVEIVGFPTDCKASASGTAKLAGVAAAKNIGTVADFKTKDEKAKLDELIKRLNDSPGDQAYLISYSTKGTNPYSVRQPIHNALSYFQTQDFPTNRIKTIEAGARAKGGVEVWIVPYGSPEPKVDPVFVEPPAPKPPPTDPSELKRKQAAIEAAKKPAP